MHFLNKGTALIIPLGKGKYEAIISEKNLENVRTRLGGYASLSGDQERNTGKKLSHIYVMGEEIEQHEVKSILIEYDIDGRTFNYHFAFNPVFAEKGYVNFFKGLPILQTKYNLGFIIDSQIFDVDDRVVAHQDFRKEYVVDIIISLCWSPIVSVDENSIKLRLVVPTYEVRSFLLILYSLVEEIFCFCLVVNIS